MIYEPMKLAGPAPQERRRNQTGGDGLPSPCSRSAWPGSAPGSRPADERVRRRCGVPEKSVTVAADGIVEDLARGGRSREEMGVS